MKKHTAGPWIVDESHEVDHQHLVWAEDVIIAEVCEDQHNQGEANARLIASAPDLLEACREALNVLEDWDDLNQPDDGPEWLFVTAMKAAIDKACA